MTSYADAYLNLPKMQANALLQSSMAGQVADMADSASKALLVKLMSHSFKMR